MSQLTGGYWTGMSLAETLMEGFHNATPENPPPRFKMIAHLQLPKSGIQARCAISWMKAVVL